MAAMAGSMIVVVSKGHSAVTPSFIPLLSRPALVTNLNPRNKVSYEPCWAAIALRCVFRLAIKKSFRNK